MYAQSYAATKLPAKNSQHGRQAFFCNSEDADREDSSHYCRGKGFEDVHINLELQRHSVVPAEKCQ